MQKDTQPDKNKPIADTAVSQRVEELLGPPPQDTVPAKTKAEAEPMVSPTLPVDAVTPDASPDPKERLLVIPSSDESKSNVTAAAESEAAAPTAGETIAPTEPQSKEATTTAKTDPPPKPAVSSNGGKIKRFFRKWWHNRKARRLTIIAIAVVLFGIVVYPNSRYFILNTAGVRGSASLTVLDNSTQLPLKNVEVSLAGQTAKTNEQGNVKIEHVKLGRSQLVIQKRAFASVSKSLTIGWGSNPLGNFQIEPTGSQYAIYVVNWLNGRAITSASASGGDADAVADKDGKILLTIDTTTAQQDSLNVTVKADGYRDEKIVLNLSDKKGQFVRMVVARKNIFVTNRSGKYDVYSVNVDGKNEKLVLAGSGLERPDVVLVQHPTEDEAALVSTRVNAHNSDGYLLSTLTLINLDDNSTQAIAQSEQIQVIGWIGTRLLYVQIAAGASAANPQRFRLMSYDYKTADKKQLDSANYFNDIMLDGNYIYYAPSSAYKTDPNNGLVQSNADGSVKKTLIKSEVWNIFRVSYDSLNLATAKDWYSYQIGGHVDAVKLSQAPPNAKNRLYITSPDGKNSLWVDQRDGKGLLIDYDTAKQTDTTVETKKGLIYPVKWLTNDVVVYRVHDDQQTADYVVDITGGAAHKITNLFNAPGIDRWYYY